jgi:precorrin-3B synthase
MLVRVRIPGGLITLEQTTGLAELARKHGDGFLDLTARANVQLRGIREGALPNVADALAAIGLLPSAAHDRSRNIFASPFAGIDARELIDVRPLVRAFDEGVLADARFARLPAKFSVSFDGGASCAPDVAGTDLALQAVPAPHGLRLHLAIGGAPAGLGLKPDEAVQSMLQASLAALPYGPRRLKQQPDAATHVISALASRLAPCPAPQRKAFARMPLGALPAHAPCLVNIVPLIPLGRLSARQAAGIAAIVGRRNGELRIAPRSAVLGTLPRAELAQIRRELERLDLRLDAASGYAGIVACSGLTGCTKALADVRADAAKIAERIAQRRLFGTTLNLAACEKRCAMPAGADIDLVATAAGYDIRINV